MKRRKKARQPRGSAITGPVGKPCVRAGSPDQHSTAGTDRHGSPHPETARSDGADAPLTEAEILLGVTSWLAATRDWFDEETTLARGRLGLEPGDAAGDGASLTLQLSDIERMLAGLRNAVGHLDALAIDPARIRAFVDSASTQGAPPGTVH